MSEAVIRIRHAEADDLEALTDIYNHYIRHTVATFDTTAFAPEARRGWLAHYAQGTPHQLWVASRGHTIIGYASSSQFRPKPAYDSSIETSVYLHPDELGAGVGRTLYEQLFSQLAQLRANVPLHRAYAGIARPNAASEALHKAFNFEHIGTFSQAGYKFDAYHDVAWYEKSLQYEPIAYEKAT